MQTREDEVKGRGKLGKSQVHEAVEGGMKRTGRMLPDPSPGSPAGKCDKKPLPRKPREGALPALPIPPAGGGDSLPTRSSGSDQGTQGRRYYFPPNHKPLPRRQRDESEFDKSAGFQGAAKLSLFLFPKAVGRS